VLLHWKQNLLFESNGRWVVIEKVASWFNDNQALVYFLVAQGVALIAAVLSITAYMVELETRVNILEVRGSPHLAVIDGRLTVLESQTKANKESVDRIVEIMTKNLSVNPSNGK
jgi:hypothetical protein